MSSRAGSPDQRRGLVERGLAQEPNPENSGTAAEIATPAEAVAVGVQV